MYVIKTETTKRVVLSIWIKEKDSWKVIPEKTVLNLKDSKLSLIKWSKRMYQAGFYKGDGIFQEGKVWGVDLQISFISEQFL